MFNKKGHEDLAYTFHSIDLSRDAVGVIVRWSTSTNKIGRSMQENPVVSLMTNSVDTSKGGKVAVIIIQPLKATSYRGVGQSLVRK